MTHLLSSALLSLVALSVSASTALAATNSQKAQYKRPDTIPFPSSNPYQASKAALGKMLFFDPRLSDNQNISCATCHNPSFGWEQGQAISLGVKNTALPRHNPTILNLAWGESFFWDGRSGTLEDQALGPIQSDIEMNMPLDKLEARIKSIKGYQPYFDEVFNGDITSGNIAKAIATFERTVVSGMAPFDYWINGDESAISESAKKGFAVFNGKAQCSQCHTGWNFTDDEFHDIGLVTQDQGRYAIDPSTEQNRFAFKTPGLRNISLRAPYMHNGEMPSLTAVIAHYMGGGVPRASLSPEMKPVPLNASEMRDLEAFLMTLQGDDEPMSLPELPL
ncbi:c-type cytochrome [Vibrio sp.]|nr:c-type cytochrome [Vibrio sp.]